MPTLNIKELIERVRTKVCSGIIEDQTFIAETCVLCDFATAAESKLSTLRDDLASVTAERQNWKEWAEEARAMFHKQIDAAAVMKTRAEQAEQRNAELVEQLKAHGKYGHDTTMEDRNDKLVAALREMEQPLCNASQLIAGWRNTTPEVEWSDFDESAFLGLAEVMKRIHAIASAESATPAKQEVKS